MALKYLIDPAAAIISQNMYLQPMKHIFGLVVPL